MSESTSANLLEFFAYEHLPERLQKVSKPCGQLARQMVEELSPQSQSHPEMVVGLRKLLEAKDCFVRAQLVKKDA